MTERLVERIARTVLYEGYNLYPYRASSVKNQRRFNFGVLAPQAFSAASNDTERCNSQTECLVLGDEHTTIDVTARFLQLEARDISDVHAASNENPAAYLPVASLEVDGELYSSWQEAVEREVVAQALALHTLVTVPQQVDFVIDGLRRSEPIHDAGGQVAGEIARRRWRLQGTMEIAAAIVGDGLARVTVRVLNTTPFDDPTQRTREEALVQSLVSAHTVLRVHDGEFVSLLEPPDEYRAAAAACSNVGTWPVLVGPEGERSVMLSSPIILYDYPQVAPESVGDLFDGTEIDEILMLRIMTLTDDEKREMRSLDDRTRRILERAETLLPEQLMKMHGVVRGLRPGESDTQ